MSFPRHREIFPSDGDAGFAANVPAHRLDEFPAGYSLAGCSPAWRFRFTSWPPVCCNVVLPVEKFSPNGQLCLNCLCQPRGQAHVASLLREIKRFVSVALVRCAIVTR